MSAKHLLLICAILFLSLVTSGQRSHSNRKRGKKKVVIIGEMSDFGYELAANSSNLSLNEVSFEDYDDFTNRQINYHKYRRPVVVKRTGYGPMSAQPGGGRTPSGSVFVPVAAYSVTHSRVGTGDSVTSGGSVRRMKGPVARTNYQLLPSPSSPDKTTESAVYGYVQKPEVVEFRGQYFYGQNPTGSSSGHDPISTGSSSNTNRWSNAARISNKDGGLGPGGMLLATLPLILAPMLSYLFTPMIIPVTATIAAGRKRRRRSASGSGGPVSGQSQLTANKTARAANLDGSTQWTFPDSKIDPRLKELQVIANYLRKVHYDDKDRDKAMASYLQCDGMLQNGDQCLERLACEFADPVSHRAPEIDRAVTSILIGHILTNQFIDAGLKGRLKMAAIHGKDHSGKCAKFTCAKVAS
ncbi:hypothetical protein HDE_01867 [Halotydeus destructor]|nr:hypothetical protein HDE_01867 [Halotydeus destructor]